MELFPVKIDVIFTLYGDQMDVCMGYFEAQDDYRYPFARYFALDFDSNALSEQHHVGQGAVVEIENVIHLLFRNDQRMSFGERIDVQECIEIVIFGDFVRWNLASDDA